MDCVYSLQKQMGRPRKRLRESEHVETADLPVEAPVEHSHSTHNFNDMPNFTSFDSLISMPVLQDTQSSNGSSGHGAMTPAPYDFSLSDPFGMPHFSNAAYVASFQR